MTWIFKGKLLLFSLLYICIANNASAQPYFSWAKNLGGWAQESERTIITDSLGNVYATGSFQGTADFDPGVGVLNFTSAFIGTDVYVTKLDTDGNFLWAKQMGGISSAARGIAVATDTSGNVCIMGTFDGTIDFDPGSGTSNLTSVGFNDIFIVKLDSDGNFIWARSMGGTSDESGKSIAIDLSGNIFSIGDFTNSADFDPGPGTAILTSTAYRDLFISKLDANGNFVWAKRIGGTGSEQGQSIATDALGNLYATGIYMDTVDFDPGIGVTNLNSVGWADLFVLKLDANGDFNWAKSVGVQVGVNPVYGYSITTDNFGNVLTTGSYKGTADFDPGPGTAYFTSTNATGLSFYVLKLDSNGDYVWAKSMGPNVTSAFGKSIATDATGNIYTTGYFNGTIDFDPGPGVVNRSSNGCFNLFISMLDSDGNYLWADALGETNSTHGYSITTDDMGGVFVAGEFDGAAVDLEPGAGVTNLSGFNKMFVLKLETCVTAETACHSYTWNGTTYYTSGTYYWTGPSAGWCEVATLELTINNNAVSTTTETACGSYTWNGTTYNATGLYDWVGISAQGCDSTATLDLTITTVSDVTTSIDGNTIQANNVGASYVWLDCNNSFAVIPGETSQSYTPSTNGSYAVQITEAGCVDTSACVTVSTTGIIKNSFDNNFVLYPNPTEGNFLIDFKTNMDVIEMKITDASGRIIAEQIYENINSIEYELDEPKGVYFVQLSDKLHQKSIIKLVKK